MDNRDILVGRASTTMSSTIGNAVTVLRDHLYSRYPRGYFKHFHVNTALASKMMEDRDREDASDENVHLNEIPSMSVSPRYTGESNTAMQELPYWRQVHSFLFKNTRRNYVGVLFNDEEKIFVYSIPDRVKVEFDVKVRFDTIMQQMDFVNYTRQMFSVGKLYYLNGVRMESEIPKSFIRALMAYKGADPSDRDQVDEFYSYLRKFSMNRIEYKRNLSNGTNSFFYGYDVNLLCNLEEVSGSDYARDGMAEEKPTVDMRFTMEMWVPTSYVLETKQRFETDESELPTELLSDGSTGYINHSVKLVPRRTIGDYTLLIWQGFVSDVNVRVDRLPLDEVFSRRLNSVIGALRETEEGRRRLDEILTFSLYADGQPMSPDRFNILWDGPELTVDAPLYNVTHHLGVYARMDLLNDALAEIENTSYRFKEIEL
jgi:hypothetical protein